MSLQKQHRQCDQPKLSKKSTQTKQTHSRRGRRRKARKMYTIIPAPRASAAGRAQGFGRRVMYISTNIYNPKPAVIPYAMSTTNHCLSHNRTASHTVITRFSHNTFLPTEIIGRFPFPRDQENNEYIHGTTTPATKSILPPLSASTTTHTPRTASGVTRDNVGKISSVIRMRYSEIVR